MKIQDLLVPVAAVLMGVTGCAGSHVFVPQDHALPLSSGSELPSALYRVPTRAPQGELRVSVLGVKNVAPAQREVTARIVVANDSDDPWAIDPQRERMAFADGKELPPQQVILDGEAASAAAPLSVAPHAQRVIDLVWRLGKDQPGTRQMVLHWTLSTPSEYVTWNTSFVNEEVEPKIAAGPPLVDGYYWAPIYYAPPAYPYYGFGPHVQTRAARQARKADRVVPSRPPITVAPPGK